MKKCKRLISILLCIAMIMSNSISSIAMENSEAQSETESKIVEQLKEDLGEERAEKILNGKVVEEETEVSELENYDETVEDELDIDIPDETELESDIKETEESVIEIDGISDESKNEEI